MKTTCGKDQGNNNLSDIMYQRLKNRERQRRYRERKRLQAEKEKASGAITLAPAQVVLQLENKVMNNSVTRVYCPRDWKKDARNAHADKQELLSSALSSHAQSITHEAQASCLPSVSKAAENDPKILVPSSDSLSRINQDIVRSKSGRRDWKAEARKKKCN